VLADVDVTVATEQRMRLVRNKSSSSSLSLMTESRENLGDRVKIDCSTWVHRGAKFGQLSQLQLQTCIFPVIFSLSHVVNNDTLLLVSLEQMPR